MATNGRNWANRNRNDRLFRDAPTYAGGTARVPESQQRPRIPRNVLLRPVELPPMERVKRD
jgi:hypothetical protein